MTGVRFPAPLIAGALLLASCGTAFTAGQPWDPNEGRFFDDGIDLIAEPSKLSGEWAFRCDEELGARVSLADLIAVVKVGTVQTTQDLDGLEAKRIDTSIVEVLYGQTPTGAFALRSSKESMGYPLIIRHERHLTGSQLLFLRWFEDDKGALDHHFHLSPASPEVLKKVRRKIKRRETEEEAAMMAH